MTTAVTSAMNAAASARPATSSVPMASACPHPPSAMATTTVPMAPTRLSAQVRGHRAQPLPPGPPARAGIAPWDCVSPPPDRVTCAPGRLPCPDGSCIGEATVCDGHHDCRDGWDESPTGCAAALAAAVLTTPANASAGEGRRCRGAARLPTWLSAALPHSPGAGTGEVCPDRRVLCWDGTWWGWGCDGHRWAGHPTVTRCPQCRRVAPTPLPAGAGSARRGAGSVTAKPTAATAATSWAVPVAVSLDTSPVPTAPTASRMATSATVSPTATTAPTKAPTAVVSCGQGLPQRPSPQ